MVVMVVAMVEGGAVAGCVVEVGGAAMRGVDGERSRSVPQALVEVRRAGGQAAPHGKAAQHSETGGASVGDLEKPGTTPAWKGPNNALCARI